jgi:hypothetical protein
VRGRSTIGVLGRRKDLANLRLPHVPGVRTPEVIDPEKSTLQQIGPEPGGIVRGEEQPAHLLHDDHRALKQFIAGQLDDQMTRPARGIKGDQNLRQLRHPD